MSVVCTSSAARGRHVNMTIYLEGHTRVRTKVSAITMYSIFNPCKYTVEAAIPCMILTRHFLLS